MRMDNGTGEGIFAFILLSFFFRAFCSLVFFFSLFRNIFDRKQTKQTTKTKLLTKEGKKTTKVWLCDGKVKVSKKLSMKIAMAMQVMEQGQNCWAVASALSKYLFVKKGTFPSAVRFFLAVDTVQQPTTYSWPILISWRIRMDFTCDFFFRPRSLSLL